MIIIIVIIIIIINVIIKKIATFFKSLKFHHSNDVNVAESISTDMNSI